MSNQELIELLLDKGFDSGWALSDGTLILWEHKENPPAPLKRPEE